MARKAISSDYHSALTTHQTTLHATTGKSVTVAAVAPGSMAGVSGGTVIGVTHGLEGWHANVR
jgi:hypothetical protein